MTKRTPSHANCGRVVFFILLNICRAFYFMWAFCFVFNDRGFFFLSILQRGKKEFVLFVFFFFYSFYWNWLWRTQKPPFISSVSPAASRVCVFFFCLWWFFFSFFLFIHAFFFCGLFGGWFWTIPTGCRVATTYRNVLKAHPETAFAALFFKTPPFLCLCCVCQGCWAIKYIYSCGHAWAQNAAKEERYKEPCGAKVFRILFFFVVYSLARQLTVVIWIGIGRNREN